MMNAVHRDLLKEVIGFHEIPIGLIILGQMENQLEEIQLRI